MTSPNKNTITQAAIEWRNERDKARPISKQGNLKADATSDFMNGDHLLECSYEFAKWAIKINEYFKNGDFHRGKISFDVCVTLGKEIRDYLAKLSPEALAPKDNEKLEAAE